MQMMRFFFSSAIIQLWFVEFRVQRSAYDGTVCFHLKRSVEMVSTPIYMEEVHPCLPLTSQAETFVLN